MAPASLSHNKLNHLGRVGYVMFSIINRSRCWLRSGSNETSCLKPRSRITVGITGGSGGNLTDPEMMPCMCFIQWHPRRLFRNSSDVWVTKIFIYLFTLCTFHFGWKYTKLWFDIKITEFRQRPLVSFVGSQLPVIEAYSLILLSEIRDPPLQIAGWIGGRRWIVVVWSRRVGAPPARRWQRQQRLVREDARKQPRQLADILVHRSGGRQPPRARHLHSGAASVRGRGCQSHRPARVLGTRTYRHWHRAISRKAASCGCWNTAPQI